MRFPSVSSIFICIFSFLPALIYTLDISDYEMYELLDTMASLTKHTSFYELFAVTPSASAEEIGAAFRKASRAWHPDKNPSKDAAAHYAMLASVATILKDKEARAKYDWLVNEAPAWHRSTYYVRKWYKSTTAKLSIVEVFMIVLGFACGCQLISQWTRFFVYWYMVWSARRAVGDLGVKEVKRMKRKLGRSDPAFLASMNADYENMTMATAKPPRIPLPTDLFIFQLPYFCLFLAINMVRRKICSSPKRHPDASVTSSSKKSS